MVTRKNDYNEGPIFDKFELIAASLGFWPLLAVNQMLYGRIYYINFTETHV